MKRDFATWLSGFVDSIADYGYYTDFEKVYRNVEEIKVELHMLDSLIGSKNIESDFLSLVTKHKDVLKCIPILLAVRSSEIKITDDEGAVVYDFDYPNLSMAQYVTFMRKSGLFELLSNRLIHSVYDYVTGVEVGLDSNGRKNRGGHLMEDLVESYLIKAGLKRDVNYFKEMTISQISYKWDIDLSGISNEGKSEKRFDFVVKTKNMIYGIETNFYGSGGSKLNETARSYKTIALEAKGINGFTFVWFTDGQGWNSARHNLEETFDVLDTVYCIKDMERGVMLELFK